MLDYYLAQIGYNTKIVIIGCAFLGIASGCIGSFLFLRKRALVSDALSHSTLPGLVVAFLFLEYFKLKTSLLILLFGAGISGGLAAFLIHYISAKSRLTEDVAIGSILAIFFGFGVTLLSVLQNMSTENSLHIMGFIFGQAAALSVEDAVMIGITSFVLIGVILLSFKELIMVCFDREFGHAQFWPVSRYDMLLLTLVCIIMLVGLQTVGIILMIALLIIPPVAARFWTNRVKPMVMISSLIGGVSSSVGVLISTLYTNIPTGSIIVLVAACCFIFSFIFAPERGLLVLIQFRTKVK